MTYNVTLAAKRGYQRVHVSVRLPVGPMSPVWAAKMARAGRDNLVVLRVTET